MSGRLQGKRAFVTAAAAGIGRASALAFAREGAEVIATDIDAAGLASLAKESASIATRALDARDFAAIRAAAADAGEIDILLNAAGFVHQGTLLDCDEKAWDFSFDLNVKSVYRMLHAFLPGMIARKRGSVISIASVASSIRGVPNRAAYSATKAALIGLTKAVAADTVAHGVRVNAICPGTVETPSLHDRINQNADPVAARAAFIARQPMGRLGTADEIAALAVYLASDESSYTTGAIHVIDGGWTC
ncbi:MAG: SDR family oxidoreductase [Planctomycetota bacterium]|nr:SDR family oxidoreductase [Planctomycetota bacterium]